MSTEPPTESPGEGLQRLSGPQATPEGAERPDTSVTPADAAPSEPAAVTPPAPATPSPPDLDSGSAEELPDDMAVRYDPFVMETPPVNIKLELDRNGMPRPARVPEQDPAGTRVQRSALRLSDAYPGRWGRSAAQTSRPQSAGQVVDVLSSQPTFPRRLESASSADWRGCLWSLSRVAAIFSAVAIIVLVGALSFGYFSIASALPGVDDLRARASQFETARLYDAEGNLLYEIVDPQAGRRTSVPLGKISPYLIAATIATEDKDFYSHAGFDPIAIVRAIWQNLQAGDTVSGASTITQQLVRALVLSPEERAQRTAMRKIREVILAAEITRRYSKSEILELYLNEIYYGNLAYGIEAASETYFRKRAADLTLGEAAFLAGLPQAPAIYDVFTNPQAAFDRQSQVLGLMLRLGCVPVSTQPDAVCVKDGDVIAAQIGLRTHPFTPPRADTPFPHWVNYIRQLLEQQYGAQSLYRSGYSVFTTLDPDMQRLAETHVAEQVAALADRHVTNGALVALRPTTGEILAMVGSEDYDDPVDGQINMALRPRQPGSSIKPLTYALAFEKGWTPATLIWDVPTEFPDGANPPYRPVNYDGYVHGPVRVRSALGSSYNIPAVKALQFAGLYEQGGLVQFAQTLGITTLTRDDYGLALTLGGGEIPLLELVGAYGALANGGRSVFPVGIVRVTDFGGTLVCQQPLVPADRSPDLPPCQTPPANWGQPVMSPETAFLISDILADNGARAPAFGSNSPLLLSFPAAVKTGTTNDFRDNWTVGYTPDLVAGVWVGNADFTPMVNTSGVTGAAPVWHDFMESVLGGGRASPFSPPQGIVEKPVCAISGAEPGEFCPPDAVRTELFSATSGPMPKERDLWQRAFIDPFTRLRQTADCARYYQDDRLFEQERIVIGVSDPWAQKWLTDDPNGQAWAASHNITPPITWAPTASCLADSPHPLVSLAYPAEGAVLDAAPIQILGQAGATADFDHFIVDFGLSHEPGGWGSVMGPNSNPYPDTGRLADWDMSSLPDGPVTLRVIVFGKSGGTAEARVRFHVQRPTPTPAPTATSTPSPTVTTTPTVTPTPSETPAPLPTPSAPPTLPPTATPEYTAPAEEIPTVTPSPG